MSKHAIRATLFLAAALTSASANATNFFEGFDGTGGAGTAWETSNWSNGDIFGCAFAYSEVWRTGGGSLQLNVNSGNRNSVRSGEVRSWQSFTYGKFVARLQPGTIEGGNSSFFLYTGQAGTSSHYEIDIEFIRGGRTLHTNVWTAGRQNYQQFSVATGWRTIGFEWRPGFVRWFNVDNASVEREFRRVNVSIPVSMRLFLNHWVGNNSAGAVGFVGTYNGGGGPAYYDWVRVSD